MSDQLQCGIKTVNGKRIMGDTVSSSSPQSGGRDFLRWCAVIPGGMLAGFLALFPLHWILYIIWFVAR
jgi:hypothetical protein